MFLKCLGSIIPCAKHKKNRLNSLSEICGKQRMSQLNFLLCDFWIRRHDSANGRSENGQNDTVFSSLFYTNATEARVFLWTIPTAWLGTALPCWTVQLQSAGAAEMQPDLREEMHIGHQRCRTLCSLCITDNQGFIHVPQCMSWNIQCSTSLCAQPPVLCVSFSEAERDFALKLFMSKHFLLGSSSDSN